MGYSFDTKHDKWAQMTSAYDSQIDLLYADSEDTEAVFLPLDNFDVEEIL